jgi:uncharacterized protein involved in exopolysaccharide biosynthesis
MTRPREIVLPEPVRTTEKGSVLGLINFLLRHPLLVFGLPVLLGVLVPMVAIIRGARYTAESKFASQQADAGDSRFAGIAAQFGIALPSGGSAAQPLDYSVELITSQQILRDAVTTKYNFAEDEEGKRIRSGNLVELYGIKAKSPSAALRAATARLRSTVSASPNVRSGLITLRTSARWPGLAIAINKRLLDLVNEFNLEKRQSHAAEERKFIDERMNVAGDELSAAENALKQFYDENRGYEGSPQLRFEQQRLQRRVDLRQQVYISLAQAYEQARIDEVRNTPIITIVDPPAAASAMGGGMVTNALLGVFAGLVFGLICAFLIEYFQREAAEDPRAAGELRRSLAYFRTRLNPFARNRIRGH